jgi:hypothetical protein
MELAVLELVPITPLVELAADPPPRLLVPAVDAPAVDAPAVDAPEPLPDGELFVSVDFPLPPHATSSARLQIGTRMGISLLRTPARTPLTLM